MQTNAWKKFAALYGKEMRELLPEISVVLGLVILITGIHYIKPGDYSQLIVLPYIMLAGLVVFLPFISSGRLSREWSSNTIYLMMSLPVKGGMLLGTKLLALLSQYLINSIVLVLAGMLLAFPELRTLDSAALNQLNELLAQGMGPMLLAYLLSIAGLSYMISLSFFSQLAGKLVPRFSKLFTVIIFIGTFGLVGHLIDLAVTPVLPQLGFDLAGPIRAAEHMELVNKFLAVNSLILIAAALLLLVLSSIVYNRRVEL
ncbi:MAG: hypothetical protein PHX14_06105 [Syntrophomonadaceae bacterium]|nr:hypothetical protein [Syntrophomonadaceae bacterium]